MGLGVEDPQEQRFFCGQRLGIKRLERRSGKGAKGTDPWILMKERGVSLVVYSQSKVANCNLDWPEVAMGGGGRGEAKFLPAFSRAGLLPASLELIISKKLVTYSSGMSCQRSCKTVCPFTAFSRERGKERVRYWRKEKNISIQSSCLKECY